MRRALREALTRREDAPTSPACGRGENHEACQHDAWRQVRLTSFNSTSSTTAPTMEPRNLAGSSGP